MADLDKDFPQGRPDAFWCRWCGEARNRTATLDLACRTCDAVDAWPSRA